MIVKDNSFKSHELIDGLKDGDIVKCLESVRGLCDGGSPHMCWEGEVLTKDKEYTVKMSNWSHQIIPTIVDNDACTQWVYKLLFEIVKQQ